MTDELDTDDVQSSDIKPPVKAVEEVKRDPVTGKFLAGTKAGPGRPHGAKSQFNKQVVDSLQQLWERDGAEMLETLARDKPEVIMAMVSRMIPQQLAAEAITGEKEDDSNTNTDVRITLVQQVSDATAITHNDISNAVEGELLDPIH